MEERKMIDWEILDLPFNALMAAHPHAARLIEKWYAGGPVSEGRHDDYEDDGIDPSELWREPDWPEAERYFVGADWHAYALASDEAMGADEPVCLRSPEPLPTRTGRLIRGEDVTGVSGVGHVADIVATVDGRGALVTWLGEWPTAVWHLRGVESVERLHGHDGRTRIVWDDPSLPG